MASGQLFSPTTQALFYNYKQLPIQRMLDFDFLCGRETPSVAGIINPGSEGFQKLFFGQEEIAIPVHSTIEAACAAHPTADVFINFASFRSAAASSMGALKQPTIRVVAIIAEGVPESDTKQLIGYARANNKVVIGPATVGGVQAGAFKIGDTAGTIDNIIQCKLYRPGSVGFVSKSGGMSNEMYNTIARVTDGIYEGIAIGGDVFPGSTLSDHVLRFNNIPHVKMMVVLGELGGRDEYSLVEALKQGKINKPVVAWVSGTCARLFKSEVQFGHAGVDLKGQPALKSNTGNWRACPFILGTECCERLAYYGIATNLVTYLTTKLHEGNVSAARNVSTWSGTCYLTPLIGAILADAYWGRYWTIAAFSTIYFIGMCTLTLSATVSALKPAECVDSICPSATPAQYMIFFSGLYLIALGTGGIKPCVSSFGADQFDDTNAKERVKKGSFFNWFYFSINLGALVSSSLIVWIQDDVGWGLGFGIPALFMGIAIVSFFSGTPLYRFQKPGGSPLTRVCQVLVASFHKWNVEVPGDSSLLYETPDKTSAIKGSRKLDHTDELKCLDKAAVILDAENQNGDFSNRWRLCTVTQVEELKILIRMFPIWATGIVFAAVYSQMGTMFLEQGMVMDRKIGSFSLPAASLSTFDVISVIFWVPVYDKFIIPIARKFTGKERGFSELQRMGIGLFISILSMAAAALVEMKRLALAKEFGLVDEDVPVPLSIIWQIPQYALIGAAEVFTFIGQSQFFYDESPDGMRSLCSALSLLTTSLGSYLSSLILTVVTSITTEGGKVGWIPDNLNEGHLDYYFWLLAGLSFLNMVAYVFCAKIYKQKRAA